MGTRLFIGGRLETRDEPRHPTPGSGDRFDPEWLLLTTTNDQIEQWLATTLPCANANARSWTGRRLFSDWEIQFLVSVDAAYSAKALRGVDRPLSGKQLFFLSKLFYRVVQEAEVLLTKEE